MSKYVDQITREFEKEQAVAAPAVARDDIPYAYGAITNEWLTNVLCAGHAGARVRAHRLDEPDDGACNRRRIFVSYNQAGRTAGLPESVFCKASHDLDKRIILAEIGLTQGEVAFYRDYKHLVDVETPRCLHAIYDPTTFNSILVFEDLVRLGVRFCDQNVEITRARAENQLDLLARLHGRFFDSPELKASRLPSFAGYFENFEGYVNMQHYCNEGFRQAEYSIPPRLFRRSSDIWPATLMSVGLHRRLPLTFAHNDVHIRNWYLTAGGEMALCDWQNFGGAHWGRDVAYTISTSLSPENRRDWERDLLRFYLDRLAASGGPVVDIDEAFVQYRQHLFSALAWWTSTLVFKTQPRDAALVLVGRIATAIDDLDALEAW
jgi:hypothetical protein